MLIFGSGMSTASSAHGAARDATAQARESFGQTTPKLAILFASLSYHDLDRAPAAVRELVGDVPVVGGSSGACVLGPQGVASQGVSIILLGGDDIEVASHAVTGVDGVRPTGSRSFKGMAMSRK